MVTDTSTNPIKVKPPVKTDIWIIRFLICCGIASMTLFIKWFINPDHIGYGPLFWILSFALLFKLVKMIHEWYHYWHVSIPKRPESKTEWTVDVLTTACPGEPKEMIIRTLRAMKDIRYPHTNYLCDEGDDPELKALCKKLGVIHVTRVEKINAKAGNINNALKQATGQIAVVLDPDHVPVPEFLDRVLPYFEDEKIGFVQCVQAYGNQSESIIARGAAEQTYHFYGPMMMCMNSYGTVQAIGANCTFRRSALDSIGGHAAGLSEDMHTAMQLHAKGWKSVYVPEILTRGLVPATLSSYYKQQLKWSRGTFELLFRTLPGLFKNFTWRQKIHYLTIPMYFLFGLINLIDIAVPAAALCMAEVPWEVDISQFGLFFVPLCTLSMIIRLFAQRWLLEKHERGFHLAGGLLRTATWWIFLVGFIYTIFNIKVPYIPTPKEDEHQNYIRLSIPNFITCIACLFFAWYGLSIDWSPYSMAMCFYAGLNAAMLGYIIMMSQQKFLIRLNSFIKNFSLLERLRVFFEGVTLRSHNVVYSAVRNGPVAVIVAISLTSLSYSSIIKENEDTDHFNKEIGGFYSGITVKNNNDLSNVSLYEKSFGNNFEIISIDNTWNQREVLPGDLMNAIRKKGAMPLLHWLPVINQESSDSFYISITKGNWDAYLNKCAMEFRQYKAPVLLSFSTGFDQKTNHPENFIKAWQYLYTFFNGMGISNLTWVWSPKYNNSASYYPGEKFVDWIGVSCLNYGDDQRDQDWYSFSELYAPFKSGLGKFQKPVIITEFGTVAGPDQEKWYYKALNDLREKHKEVKALVLYNHKKNFATADHEEYIADFTIKEAAVLSVFADQYSKAPYNNEPFLARNSSLTIAPSDYHSNFVSGTPGHYQLKVNNKPYYFRGVAYNTAHDWRDGNMPLTRRQVEKDFKKIKEMGANTVRRYDHGIYDKNVINIAAEFDLNVLYGFWFDPKIDYYKDSAMVKKYISNVEDKVREFKDHKAVIAWSLGNETWGLLKHSYSKPYLTVVRDHYVKLIELLARRIHEIDPDRPVFTCIEHEEYQIAGELVAFRDAAPSIDAIGVNSYYREQIEKLNHIAWQFDSLRPYLISEFGPRGYWDPNHNRTDKGNLVEDSDNEKANWYKDQWNNYVFAHKGYNIGGFAYCWHDRMEGSNTWFGLTDFKGRAKPSYFALKELWTGKKTESLPQFSIQSPASFEPGHEYTYTAFANMKNNKELNYEWYLHKDEYLERVDAIDYVDEGKSVNVKVPKEASNYRLYVYVSDAEGKVTTASTPLKVTNTNH